ncbi:SGNH/GDSL hydrolase family protein [Akkermansiaceae bacterium]|jgi:acyl-CoA thioesterase-1|nr:SGNH/GDSL hydrolase family protein [Akkermansiaceae bacterium]
MIRFLTASLLLIQLVGAAPKKGPFKQVEDVEGLPRVLLIGDSISIGYTLQVRDLLKGKANVHRPPVNCAATIHGLKGLDKWLAIGGEDKKWDVIHFNWGLHDLKYMGPNGENLADPKAKTSKQQVSEKDYDKNLRELVKRLKKTGARLVWRNTTPVPKGVRGRVPGDAAKYNKIAAKVMKEMEVEIHDLYSFAKKNEAKIQRKKDVHYTKEGSMKLAEEVVRAIAIK